MISEFETKDKLLEYHKQVLRQLPQKFTSNKEADEFIKQEPLAFLFAVILDQGARAEIIWDFPYQLLIRPYLALPPCLVPMNKALPHGCQAP